MSDDAIKEAPTTIRKTVKKPEDMVFRYGGEKFSVILPETAKKQAKVIAETIRENVEKLAIPHEGSKRGNFVTIGIGIATLIPTNSSTTESFIEIADKALYKAKSDGKNCVRG